MDYNWTIEKENGQPDIGYVFKCTTNADGIQILATVYCFPKLDQFANNKIASVSVFWECEKEKITDGFFHWIMNDIYEIIKCNENSLFDKSLNPLDMAMTQHFFVPKLPNLQYFTHGDYAIR